MAQKTRLYVVWPSRHWYGRPELVVELIIEGVISLVGVKVSARAEGVELRPRGHNRVIHQMPNKPPLALPLLEHPLQPRDGVGYVLGQWCLANTPRPTLAEGRVGDVAGSGVSWV